MSDDPIQKEIEANEARARDADEVGVDEDHLNDQEEPGNLFTDMVDTLFHPEEADDQAPGDTDHEYDDNTKST